MKLLLSLLAMGSVVATSTLASAQTVESSPYGEATSRTTSNVPFIATGALTASSFYAAALASGIGLTVEEFQHCPIGMAPNCEEDGVYMLMAIPIAGPLVTVSKVDQSAGRDAAMITMSAGQVIGLALLAFGVYDRQPAASLAGIEVTADVSPERTGLSLRRDF